MMSGKEQPGRKEKSKGKALKQPNNQRTVNATQPRVGAGQCRLQLSSSVAGRKISKKQKKKLKAKVARLKWIRSGKNDGHLAQVSDLFSSEALNPPAGGSQFPGQSSGLVPTPPTASVKAPSQQPFSASMSLDRSMPRDMNRWNHSSASFSEDFHQDSFGMDGVYTDFNQDWPNPWGPQPYAWHGEGQNWRRRRRSRWDQDSYDSQQDDRDGAVRDDGHQNWNSWQSDPPDWHRQGQPPRPMSVGNSTDFRSPVGTPPARNDRRVNNGKSNNNNRWNQFTRQFGGRHFHREDVDSAEGDLGSSGGSFRAAQADSSGLDDSGSSGGSRKRPRSLDREGKLSKSSRAERNTKGFLGPKGSRALSMSDLNGGNVQKPDSTSRQGKIQKGQRVVPRGEAARPASGSSAKASGLVGKKKQGAAKHKAQAAGPGSKAAGKTGASEEGVLERAERLCQELREKRQQAAQVRAVSSNQRVAALRNALNTSPRRFNSAHKSFLRGFLSDTGAASATAVSGSATAASASQKKRFSASSEPCKVAGPADVSASDLGDSQSSTAAASTVSSSSSQVGDIERIRNSIESSVMAEVRAGRPPISRRLSGHRSPATSMGSSAPREGVAGTSAAAATTTGGKPPLPLSKDALARMVNAPRSRSQRVQLAHILRQHTATTVTRTRPIHLDGLYDHMDDNSDSIEDVLKNISGLEEIGDCAELKNIKLEDLTCEDKLRIAELIEDADSLDKDHQPVSSELGSGVLGECEILRARNFRVNRSESSDREAEMVGVSERPRSPQRLQAASPTPSRPLSMDDLTTETSGRRSPAVRSPSPQRSSSPKSVLGRSQSPARSSQMLSLSPSRPATVEKRTVPSEDSSAVPGVVDTTSRQYSGTASSRHRPGRSSAVPMEVSSVPDPSDHILSDGLSGREGMLHEVLMLSQRQDESMAEMRNIDVELSQMYKSLIEVVARMSSLQRRRVQLQTEGEQLSVQRNQLLAGLVPNAGISLSSGPPLAEEGRQQAAVAGNTLAHPGADNSNNQVNRSGMEPPCRGSGQPPVGTSVTLPSWLSASSSNSHPTADRHEPRRKEPSASLVAEQASDVCLSGSVTSSVGSNTPRAISQNVTLNGSVDSVGEVGDDHVHVNVGVCSSVLNSRPATSGSGGRGGRTMLSISGALEMNTKDSGVASGETQNVSCVSGEASHSHTKNSGGADSSSGMGSSISTHTSSGQKTGLAEADPPSQLDLSSSISNKSTSPNKQGTRVQAAGPNRIVFNSMSSPPQNPSSDLPKSPGVSVAYLGSLSSVLVQQIVRNLPLTSQLGEVTAPSMYVLKSGPPATGSVSRNPSADGDAPFRGGASSTDGPSVKSRIRTTSMQSISSVTSDLSSGEQTLSTSVPPLKLSGDSDRGGSKTCTPRSESDAHSVTSGTSLGEQIKLFSERNSQGTASSLSSLSFIGASVEEGKEKETSTVQDMTSCSVCLEKLDFEKMEKISMDPESWRLEEEDIDRPKRRKTKKDRNQSLHRRRHFMVDSSSEGEEDEVNLLDINSTQQHVSSALPGSEELMEADGGGVEGEELDSTLVGSGEQLSQDEDGAQDSQASTARPVSPSRLKLNPDNLKAFRANVRRNLTSSPALESSTENAGKSNAVDSVVIKKERLKFSGPCAPVVGLHVHGNLLYICFQGIGINSYTLDGDVCAEYPSPSAQCFTLAPVGSGSQYQVAVGGQDQLTFLSTSDQSVVSSVDTVLKVMCLLVVDTTLFAGLDCGSVMVISLTTLQETRRFQASDCAVHNMTWTREGSTRLLCVSSQDANIQVIDASSGLPVRIISGHTKTAFALCMFDHFVLSGSGDRKVMAHNVHTAAFQWELQDHKGIITSVCVDNGLLFSAGYDKVIRCYDLKNRKLLHLMYGAGKSIIMRMVIHNSVLYTGNRDGQVECVDLRDLGSFACQCVSCCAVYGLKEHLWHHLVADHLLPNAQAMRCPWTNCSTMLNTGSALVKAGEHMRSHIDKK